MAALLSEQPWCLILCQRVCNFSSQQSNLDSLNANEQENKLDGMEIDLSEDGYNSVQTFKEFQVCLVKIPTD